MPLLGMLLDSCCLRRRGRKLLGSCCLRRRSWRLCSFRGVHRVHAHGSTTCGACLLKAVAIDGSLVLALCGAAHLSS